MNVVDAAAIVKWCQRFLRRQVLVLFPAYKQARRSVCLAEGGSAG
ncbi:hypothetical protein [Calothrix sp. NIES-2098]|nr:hypothetical protein NIES2098_64220 [Calothrix sp. NIES-2098]